MANKLILDSAEIKDINNNISVLLRDVNEYPSCLLDFERVSCMQLDTFQIKRF